MLKGFLGSDPFIFWKGVVEDRRDPLHLGRLRVRIFGHHTEDKVQMPTEELPWATPILPINNTVDVFGPKEGDWVLGFFLDSHLAQQPVVWGILPGINTQTANPEVGYGDPTPANQLDNTKIPRPPEFGAPENFGAMIVNGIQDSSSLSIKTFLESTLDQNLDSVTRSSIQGLLSQVSKLDSKSLTNLAQRFVQNPSDLIGDAKRLSTEFGMEGINRLLPNNVAQITSGLSSLQNMFGTVSGLHQNFKSILQTTTQSKLSSLFTNNIPPGVRNIFNSLDSGNPLNKIMNQLSVGGQFDIGDLFDGNIVSTVESVVDNVLGGLEDTAGLLKKLGEKAFDRIAEFLGLERGFGDELIPKLFEDENETTDPLKNPNEIPIQTSTFGMLAKEFDIATFPYNLNNDTVFDEKDVDLLLAQNVNEEGFFDPGGSGDAIPAPIYPMSRYPLEPFLNEPTSSRLARNEKIANTIVAKKKGNLQTFGTASYTPIVGMSLGTPSGGSLRSSGGNAVGATTDQQPSEGEPFDEPESPYDAKPPYNHVHESESGHTIEIDDTPGAERLHWYHRAGTFREIHPDGTLVDKCVKKLYSISLEDYFIGTPKNWAVSAGESIKILAGTELTMESASTQLTTGPLSVKCGTKMEEIGGGHAQKITDNKEVKVKGDYILKVDGDFTIKVKGKFKVESETTALDSETYTIIRSAGLVINEAPIVGNNAELFNVSGVANLFPTFTATETPNPELPIVPEVEKEEEVPSAFKPGFEILFNDGSGPDAYNVGYLYKPKSDSDGKPVMLNPPGSGPMGIYEAIPTAELEEVTIRYQFAQGQFTEWPVKRPKHKKGKLIEMGIYKGIANGGRAHWRFSKYAKDYPKSFMVADGVKEFLVHDGKYRHD